MGLREQLNRNPLIVAIVGIALVALAAYVVYSTATDRGLTPKQVSNYYFTTDDGKTLFSAPTTSVPPFMKDGKPAVLAHVFTCDKSKTQFVGFLMKYNDSFAKQAREEQAKAEQSGQPVQGGGMLSGPAAAMNMLIKKPGDSEWVPMASPKGSEMAGIWCPSRDPWDLVELFPE